MKAPYSMISFLIFAFIATSSFAQRNCGTMEHLEYQRADDPKLDYNLEKIEKHTELFINNPVKAVNGVVTIPVVVHVLYNNSSENISDAQVLSQISVLNDDFRRTNSDADNTWSQAADSEIEFCMATKDPNGNATNGITRTSTSVSSFGLNDEMKYASSGGKDAWPTGDYLNLWVCDITSGYLGYAQFPGSGSAATDGVVIDYMYYGTTGTATAPFDLGRTATHEVGHWLNLRHIWGDGACGVDDFVSDTPTSDAANYGCATGHSSCGSTDMVQNYMDYSDDACMNLFTGGQKDRMRALFDGGFRASLLNSDGCGGGVTPTCSDGIQNGDETGVDCGGSICPPCSCNGTMVTVTITFDNYPEETSWTLTDGGGATVASGGTYGSSPDGSTFSEDICLADGCYDFTISDSYGDGICCSYGSGSYSVTDSGTLASGGSFTSSETTNFCVGGSTPTCSDGIQNGDETGVDCGGSCSPCASCNDGIQNGDETGVDCGGSCSPCPTCNDGIQNGDETGVDCGGSCSPCATCNDGIQNGDETGVDCGGSCDPCDGGGCSYVAVDSNNFDSSWGLWNDGGSDCRRSSRDANYAYSGNYCVRIRDNTSTSTTTTDNMNLTAYDELTVSFIFYPRSMENNEDFWVQISTNGGSSYSTVASYAAGSSFNNGSFYTDDVVISGPFSSNTRLRFRCDASGNSDYIYLDDVVITGCLNSARGDGSIEFISESLESTLEDVKDVSTITDLNLYPNPTSGALNVSFNSSDESELHLVVTDMTGKTVEERKLNTLAGKNEVKFDANEYVQGIYFIHLMNEDFRISKRFVVMK